MREFKFPPRKLFLHFFVLFISNIIWPSSLGMNLTTTTKTVKFSIGGLNILLKWIWRVFWFSFSLHIKLFIYSPHHLVHDDTRFPVACFNLTELLIKLLQCGCDALVLVWNSQGRNNDEKCSKAHYDFDCTGFNGCLEITAISLQVYIHNFHINIPSSGSQQLETFNWKCHGWQHFIASCVLPWLVFVFSRHERSNLVKCAIHI